MKAAKVTADSGDVVSVEPGRAGTAGAVLLVSAPAVGAVRAATTVELDESAALAVADLLVEARRSALTAAAEAAGVLS